MAHWPGRRETASDLFDKRLHSGGLRSPSGCEEAGVIELQSRWGGGESLQAPPPSQPLPNPTSNP